MKEMWAPDSTSYDPTKGTAAASALLTVVTMAAAGGLCIFRRRAAERPAPDGLAAMEMLANPLYETSKSPTAPMQSDGDAPGTSIGTDHFVRGQQWSWRAGKPALDEIPTTI
jgi:hypothetical protein